MMIKPGPELQHFLNVFQSWSSTLYVTRKIFKHIYYLLRFQRSMDLSNGNALVARLAKTAFDRGVVIETEAEALALLHQQDRVAGVRYRHDGEVKEVTARRGVVLAGGGFPHDVERRRALYRHASTGREHWSPAPSGNTGDGLRLAESVGGHIDANMSNPAGWAPVSLVPKKGGEVAVFPHLIDRQKPGFIAVTREGKRFVNEANSYHDFGKALAAACESEPECFLICDHEAIRRYGLGAVRPAPVPMGTHLKSGYLKRGRTLDELAAACGINACGLAATLAHFNDGAAQGIDREFHRGESIYNRYNGDLTHTPNPCVAPLNRPPFYAVRIVMGELGTFAGIATDPRARVLDKAGDAIDGLYAVGNDMAHVMAGDYMGGGATLGPALTFGYVAGCELAAATYVEQAPFLESGSAGLSTQ
jgi:succinate dehydrogenase/fumarate reductase flavoprotein subunit